MLAYYRFQKIALRVRKLLFVLPIVRSWLFTFFVGFSLLYLKAHYLFLLV